MVSLPFHTSVCWVISCPHQNQNINNHLYSIFLEVTTPLIELLLVQMDYEIEYRANDPRVLTSERSLDVDSERKGWFGGGSEVRSEHRRDEYTMDGARNIDGGAVSNGEGKSHRERRVYHAEALGTVTSSNGR